MPTKEEQQQEQKPARMAMQAKETKTENVVGKDSIVFLCEHHNSAFAIERMKPDGTIYNEYIGFTNGAFLTRDKDLAQDVRNSVYFEKAIWEGVLPRFIEQRRVRNLPKLSDDTVFAEMEEAEFAE